LSYKIINANCLDVLSELDPVDAVVTDPPYGISFMGGVWDHGIPGVQFWKAISRAAKPGAYLLVFGGTRTYHRLMCAIEDAGLEIRDCIMWVYGTGFPKSLDVSKAIDKEAGTERKVIGTRKQGALAVAPGQGFDRSNVTLDITIPATKAAKQWDGWGTALKPAWEPIIVARKPFDRKVSENVQMYGTGALNIDGCRIATLDKWTGREMPEAEDDSTWGSALNQQSSSSHDKGRWPSNLIHDGRSDVMRLFPKIILGDEYQAVGRTGYDDVSVSRFFYCAKTSKTERSENDHPTVKPQALMRYLCRLVTQSGGTILDPFMGSGSTLLAAKNEGFNSIGIDLSEHYCEIAEKRLSYCEITERKLDYSRAVEKRSTRKNLVWPLIKKGVIRMLDYERIKEWGVAQANLKHWKAVESNLRKEICEDMFAGRTGKFTEKQKFEGDDVVIEIKATSITSYVVDEDLLESLEVEGICSDEDKACFMRKLSIVNSLLNARPSDSPVWRAITEKPGMPKLEVKKIDAA